MPFVTCPDCQKESMATRELVGLEWNRPKCGTSFIVTEDDGPPLPRRRRKRGLPASVSLALGLVVATIAVTVFVIVRQAEIREAKSTKKAGDKAAPPAAVERESPPERERRSEEREPTFQERVSDAQRLMVGASVIFGVAMVVGPFVVRSKHRGRSDQFGTALAWAARRPEFSRSSGSQ